MLIFIYLFVFSSRTDCMNNIINNRIFVHSISYEFYIYVEIEISVQISMHTFVLLFNKKSNFF